jgi:hypothetical protein
MHQMTDSISVEIVNSNWFPTFKCSANTLCNFDIHKLQNFQINHHNYQLSKAEQPHEVFLHQQTPQTQIFVSIWKDPSLL